MNSANRDMLVVFPLALLWLSSVSQARPLTCEDLSRPVDQLDPHHLLGEWALVSGGFCDPADLDFFKLRDSSRIHFSNTSVSSNLSYTPSTRFAGTCHSRTFSVTVEGGTLTFDEQDRVNLTVTFIHTSCLDCVVMRFDNKSNKAERLLLFSRRREVDMKDMEEFRAQVECLNMLPPAVMDPNKELC